MRKNEKALDSREMTEDIIDRVRICKNTEMAS